MYIYMHLSAYEYPTFYLPPDMILWKSNSSRIDIECKDDLASQSHSSGLRVLLEVPSSRRPLILYHTFLYYLLLLYPYLLRREKARSVWVRSHQMEGVDLCIEESGISIMT